MDSPHKGQWRGALMFSLICAWTNGRANNRDGGDLRRNRGHYDVTVMTGSIFSKMLTIDTLRWRHNGHDSVSNHQPHDCLLSRLFRRRSKKTSKLRVTGFCVGNSPGTGEFPAQMASNAENVSIWWRHHDHTGEGPFYCDFQTLICHCTVICTVVLYWTVLFRHPAVWLMVLKQFSWKWHNHFLLSNCIR